MNIMFFKTQSNNNNVSLNTRLTVFYSQENSLTLSAWNNNISIRIQPMIGVDSNGVRQYDNSKERTINTSITPDNAVVLYQGIVDNIIPAIKNGTNKRVSIMIGANTEYRKILTIGFDGHDSYMELTMNVDNNGVSSNPENTVRHTFSTRDYLEDYDSSDGSGVDKIVHSDLIRFTEKLKNIDNLGAAISHGIKYADMSRASFSPNNYQNNTQQNNSQPQYSAPTQNIDGSDMGDFLPFD